jgi:hypothetical protein
VVAELLGKPVGEIMELSVAEMVGWSAYLQIKQELARDGK